MKEYITKDRAKQFVCGHCNEVCSEEPCEPRDCDWMAFIDKEPAADVAPVRHGHLISTGMDELWAEFGNCTECGGDNYIKAEFCNWCGAKLT